MDPQDEEESEQQTENQAEQQADETTDIDKSPAIVEPSRFRRNRSNRVIGGVASGIARRFDIDANIVRAVFIVLAFLWGFGAALYLVFWAFVPEDPDGMKSSDVRQNANGTDRAQSPWSIGVLLAGAFCVGLIIWAFYLGAPRFGGGVGFIWLVLLAVVAVVALRQPARYFSIRRFLIIFYLFLISIIVIGSGLFLTYLAMTGVPIAGGVGVRLYQPTSVSQVHKTYETSFGKMTVDLREVPFGRNDLSVTASVAAGALTIEVPPGVVVDISATSGTPQIAYPQGYSTFYVAPHGKHEAHLMLDLKVGIGEVELIRAAPGTTGFPN